VALLWKPIVLLAAGLAMGLAISKLERGGHPPNIASASAPSPPAIPLREGRGQVQSGLPAPDQSALRSVIREELAQALANHPMAAQAAAPPSSDEPDPLPAPSQAAIERFDIERAEIDQEIRRGTWTASDRERLRSALPGLTPEMREALMRQLVVAANEGRIHSETHGPLF
jgi:hypothetical protein